MGKSWFLSIMKAFVLFALIFLTDGIVSAQKDASVTINDLLSWKETSRYEVHYGPLFLGTVTILPLRDTTYRGKPAWLAKSVIKSNPALWFVGDREEHFYGLMVRNDTMLYEVEYWKDDIDSKAMKEEHYILDYEARTATVKEKGKVVAILPLQKPTICGMAFYYQSRLYAGQNKTVEIPMLVGRIAKPIIVNQTTQKSVRITKAFAGKDSVEAFFATGKADIPGPFGFNGNFKGYFSNLPHRVPLHCYVKVWVGNVEVRPVYYEMLKK
jgi:hypothetical protein